MEQNEVMRLMRGSDSDKKYLLSLLLDQVINGEGLSELEVGILDFLKKTYMREENGNS
jgi:hypothetical protein